jgi:peptidoglycan glycosyltransferase
VAAKTGTVQSRFPGENNDAWMAGFTPQLATSVWMGTDRNSPIRTATGDPISGRTLPGEVWRGFMAAALSDTPAEPFVPFHPLGTPPSDAAPNATPTAAPTAVRSTAAPPSTPAPSDADDDAAFDGIEAPADGPDPAPDDESAPQARDDDVDAAPAEPQPPTDGPAADPREHGTGTHTTESAPSAAG